MSVRDRISMSVEEVQAFLAEPHKLQLATLDRTGAPHLVTMYYDMFDGCIGFWSYGKSQKIVNLRRDPRLTCLVEAGEDYGCLRGVSIHGRARLVEGFDQVREVGARVYGRYIPGGITEELQPFIDGQARKRVAVFVEPETVTSWDHRKLEG